MVRFPLTLGFCPVTPRETTMLTALLATDLHRDNGLCSVSAGVRPPAIAVRNQKSVNLNAKKGGLLPISSSL